MRASSSSDDAELEDGKGRKNIKIIKQPARQQQSKKADKVPVKAVGVNTVSKKTVNGADTAKKQNREGEKGTQAVGVAGSSKVVVEHTTETTSIRKRKSAERNSNADKQAQGPRQHVVEGGTATRRPVKKSGKDDKVSADKEAKLNAIPHQESRPSSQRNDRWESFRNKIKRRLQVSRGPNTKFTITKKAFRQQKLPILWQPIWECKSTGRFLLVMAIITIPLAVCLFLVQMNAYEYRFTFGEECINSRNYLRLIRSVCVYCGGALNPHCSKRINIPIDMKLPVFLYYELDGFHQNHRKISKSKDHNQLLGNIFTSSGEPIEPSENCGKYSKDEDGKIYFPCGQLADLMYNDEFSLVASNGEIVPFRTRGIAMDALKRFRFRNPSTVTPKNYNLKLDFKQHFVKPKDWTVEMWDNWWKGGGLENERFINWMNPSALSPFRKLYAIIDSVPLCPPGLLCKGNYTMNIEYRYDSDRFEGNKAFVLGTTSFFGAPNFQLSILVAVVGCTELVLGFILLYIHEIALRRQHLHSHPRRSAAQKRKHSTDEDRKNQNSKYTARPTKPLPGPSTSGSLITTFRTRNNTDAGDVPGFGTTNQPPEGVVSVTSESMPMLVLYHQYLSQKSSHEVLPDDVDYYELDEDGSSNPTPIYTTDEEETGESVTHSTSSSNSIMVSAAEHSGTEDSDRYRLRRQR